MAKTINGVNFSDVIRDALEAAKAVVTDNWDDVRDIVKNIADSLANDVTFVAKKKLAGEFNQTDARVFMDDQKMVARIRLRSLAIIGMQLAEEIWNAIADVFRKAIKTSLGWSII